MHTSYSLCIHGGCGTIAKPARYATVLTRTLEAGRALLAEGHHALDTVEHCVSLLEDDALLNAGRGSVLNAHGTIDMDASIMDGRDLAAGAVAGVIDVRNPVQLARMVLSKSDYVLLMGSGANEFARATHVRTEPIEYFRTPARVAQFTTAHKNGVTTMDHEAVQVSEEKFGTVGAVAYDQAGNLAAATSTGGIVNKRFGRVGDTPVIGAGTYADNTSGAISCTGIGEHFIRTSLAKEIEVHLRTEGVTAQEAADYGIGYLVKKVEGLGGVIVVDRTGRCGIAHSTPSIIAGCIEHGGALRLIY